MYKPFILEICLKTHFGVIRRVIPIQLLLLTVVIHVSNHVQELKYFLKWALLKIGIHLNYF